MGQIRLICDESYRAAGLVAKHFEARLDDAELVEAVLIVRAIVAESMRRLLERIRREESRLDPIRRGMPAKSHGTGPTPEGSAP